MTGTRSSVMLLGAVVGWIGAAGAQPTPLARAISDTVAVYRGVYASTSRESIFSPCDVPGIGSGWSLRFANDGDAAFLRHHDAHPGARLLAHFIRVRGRVSPPGSYGLGFQTREILVDSVLEIHESPQPCLSYEDLPSSWLDVKASGASIIGATLSDDRSLLAVIDREGIIGVWNTTARKLVKSFPSGDKGDFSIAGVSLAFRRDGKRLAVGGIDGVVRVWNTATGKRVRTFAAIDTLPGTRNGRRYVAHSVGLAYNETGTLLANMVGEKTVMLSTTSGKRLGAIPTPWGGKVLFVRDSSYIAVGDSGFVTIHPRLGAPPIWRTRLQLQHFEVMGRSPDGRWLVVKSSGDTVNLFSLSDGQPGPRIVIPSWSSGRVFAFSPDGNTLAMTGGWNGLYLWETKTGRPIRSFQNFPWNVQKVWFTADGKSMITHSMNESVFRIVHLDSTKGKRGPDGQGARPVQAAWPAYINPEHRPGRILGSVSGFVRVSPTRALPDAEIELFDGDRPGVPPIARATTNAAGHFLIQGIRAPHLIVRALKPGFSSEVKYVHFQYDRITVDLELKPQD